MASRRLMQAEMAQLERAAVDLRAAVNLMIDAAILPVIDREHDLMSVMIAWWAWVSYPHMYDAICETEILRRLVCVFGEDVAAELMDMDCKFYMK